MRQKKPRGQFTLRLVSELKSWLTVQAAINKRSLNGEIEHRLERSRAQEPVKEAA